MQNFTTNLDKARKSLSNIRGIFDRNKVEEKIKLLEKEILKEDFWKDKNQAQKTIKQKKFLKISSILILKN